jgi:hypothetical protein
VVGARVRVEGDHRAELRCGTYGLDADGVDADVDRDPAVGLPAPERHRYSDGPDRRPHSRLYRQAPQSQVAACAAIRPSSSAPERGPAFLGPALGMRTRRCNHSTIRRGSTIVRSVSVLSGGTPLREPVWIVGIRRPRTPFRMVTSAEASSRIIAVVDQPIDAGRGTERER